MAYLSPTFDHDVFVSYAHADPDGIGRSPMKTWSQLLVAELIAEIRSLSPDFRTLDFFIDRDLDPTSTLTEALRHRVDRSAILMILMSDYYLESAWCAAEREWFDVQIRDRRDLSSRVFLIRVVPTDENRWPSSLLDSGGHALPGFQFHPPPERDGDLTAPYGFPDLVERNEAFRRELAQLRTWLVRRLRDLRASQTTASAASESVQTDRPARVYLHAPSVDSAAREDIARRLREAGHTVVESVQIPLMEDPVRTALKERRARMAAAQRCDALILLRARVDDAFDNGDLFDIGVDEREKIEAERGKPLPCAVLDQAATLPPPIEDFGIARLEAVGPHWVDGFNKWLMQARGRPA